MKTSNVAEAIEMAMKKHGKDGGIPLIRNAADIVPTRKA